MLAAPTILSNYPAETVRSGTVLMTRSVSSESVLFIEQGRVVLGVLGLATKGMVERQFGMVEGPGWLEVSTSVLHVPSAVDAITQTEVRLRRVPLEEFRAGIAMCSDGVRSIILDIARANLQKAEVAVSRTEKPAEGRFAEWLLTNARTCEKGIISVHIKLNKRDLAAELGVVPETLSRLLARLRCIGLIGGRGRAIVLSNPTELRRLAGVDVPTQAFG